IIRDLIFKGEHSLDIHVTGAGDKIFFIGVLSSELIADEMAAVIEVFSVDEIVFHSVPPTWFYLTDTAPFLCGHCVWVYVGTGSSASSQIIQLTVRLKGNGAKFRFLEEWNIVIYFHIGFSRIFRDFIQIEGVQGGFIRNCLGCLFF